MTKKQKFKITGMHCTACTLEIDDALEELDGVKQSNTHYAKQITEVEFEEEKVSHVKIIEVIKKVGYSASASTE
ncbi:MAG TPA: cation transporter [Patescibacteria group bacterium]|nr:cation transporter [Patescibacteria group bacterium]